LQYRDILTEEILVRCKHIISNYLNRSSAYRPKVADLCIIKTDNGGYAVNGFMGEEYSSDLFYQTFTMRAYLENEEKGESYTVIKNGQFKMYEYTPKANWGGTSPWHKYRTATLDMSSLELEIDYMYDKGLMHSIKNYMHIKMQCQ